MDSYLFLELLRSTFNIKDPVQQIIINWEGSLSC